MQVKCSAQGQGRIKQVNVSCFGGFVYTLGNVEPLILSKLQVSIFFFLGKAIYLTKTHTGSQTILLRLFWIFFWQGTAMTQKNAPEASLLKERERNQQTRGRNVGVNLSSVTDLG